MDKEAQEKPNKYEQLSDYLFAYCPTRLTITQSETFAARLIGLGYILPPKDKPPLLSDNPYIYESEECSQYIAFGKGKRAQREADIKYYESQ